MFELPRDFGAGNSFISLTWLFSDETEVSLKVLT